MNLSYSGSQNIRSIDQSRATSRTDVLIYPIFTNERSKNVNTLRRPHLENSNRTLIFQGPWGGRIGNILCIIRANPRERGAHTESHPNEPPVTEALEGRVWLHFPTHAGRL